MCEATSNGQPNRREVPGFSPGPWRVLPDSHRVGGHPNHLFRFVSTANWTEDDGDFSVTGEIIAKLTDSPSIAANARLIAAAPDLYAACKELLRLAADPQCHGYIIRGADGSVSKVRVSNEIIADARALLAQIGGAQ